MHKRQINDKIAYTYSVNELVGWDSLLQVAIQDTRLLSNLIKYKR